MSTERPMLQSSLGVVANNSTSKDRIWNNGYLAFGKILKIHHKRYTADVKILGSQDIISSDVKQEGKYACRIGVNYSGIDSQFNKPYGEVIPLQKGMIVLVAFLKNTKEKPVIIRAFHDISEEVGATNYNNILTSIYPIDKDDSVESFRTLKVSRIQDFMTMDGIGNLEIASHTKSFFVATNKEIDEENFDYEDLSIKDKKTNKTIGVPYNHSYPLKFLLTFRDAFEDKISNWLKIFIDPIKTAVKIAKVQRVDNKLTMLEIDEKGAFKVRRQLDSKSWSGGEKFTEISIEENGNVDIVYNNAKKVTISVNDSGVSVSSDSDITFSSKTINLEGNLIKLEGNNIELEGNATLNGREIAVY